MSYTRNSDYAVFDPDGYWAYETTAVYRRQAIYAYAWIASVVAPMMIWGAFREPLGKKLGDDDLAAGLFLLLSAIAFIFPYFLRRWTKKRKAREWRRQSFGLNG